MKAILLTEGDEPIGIAPVKDVSQQDCAELMKVCSDNLKRRNEAKRKEAQAMEDRLLAIERRLDKISRGLEMALGLNDMTLEEYQNE